MLSPGTDMILPSEVFHRSFANIYSTCGLMAQLTEAFHNLPVECKNRIRWPFFREMFVHQSQTKTQRKHLQLGQRSFFVLCEPTTVLHASFISYLNFKFSQWQAEELITFYLSLTPFSSTTHIHCSFRFRSISFTEHLITPYTVLECGGMEAF